MQTTLALLIIAVAVLVFLFIINTAQKQRLARRRALEESGFYEVLDPDFSLVERIGAMRSIGQTKTVVQKLYYRSHGSYTIYVADILHGGDSSAGDRETFLLVSSDLSFPRLQIFPLAPLQGRVGKLMNRLVRYALERRGWREVHVLPGSAFSEKYKVYAQDETELQHKLGESFWERFAAWPGLYMLQTEGDVVIYRIMSADGTTPFVPERENYRGYLRTYIDAADRLHDLLRKELSRKTVT